jgi:hypothetical protein
MGKIFKVEMQISLLKQALPRFESWERRGP